VGAIAGGVVGGVAGLAAIALLAFFLIRRRRKREAAGELPASNSLTGSYAPEKAPVYAHEANNNGGVVQEADSRPYEPVPSAPVEMQGNPMSPVELPERRL
jgi:MYXO-CTERM domain-containing protein